MDIPAAIEKIKAKLRAAKGLRFMYNKFLEANLIPAHLLSDAVLKKVISNFIKNAEEKGWTAGIDLPQEEIADYILRIIKGEQISFKQQGKANQVIALIKRSTYGG